jgi:nicotinate phosphoribosyltransferase
MTSTALSMDFYQLTSAYGFWKAGKHNTRTVYHMFFRSIPFGGGYAVAAGLEFVVDWITNFRFDESDLEFLAKQTGNDGKLLFEAGFIDYLRNFRFTCDVDAVLEGTVVFPHEPLVRVTGTIVENLLIETFCLNAINSQSLLATKASRVCQIAQSDPVLEFGLRRAQEIGGVSASRACYIGGCSATSNVLAGKTYGIPVKGTHPHGFVMFFDSELEAFETFAAAMPNNCVFLVDTYDTIQGVKNAITVSLDLKARGYIPAGIRLDSGDLAYLSIEARKMLDTAGLIEMKIYASNDLDERLMASLRAQGACIAVWGVGTKMITAYDQPAFGGVYKMGAVEKDGGWVSKIKISEQIAKTTNPGILDFCRSYNDDGSFSADMIYDYEDADVLVLRLGEHSLVMVDPGDSTKRKAIRRPLRISMLVNKIKDGKRCDDAEPLDVIRKRCQLQLAKLHAGIKRLDNPHTYPVGLEYRLFEKKADMIMKADYLKNNQIW